MYMILVSKIRRAGTNLYAANPKKRRKIIRDSVPGIRYPCDQNPKNLAIVPS